MMVSRQIFCKSWVFDFGCEHEKNQCTFSTITSPCPLSPSSQTVPNTPPPSSHAQCLVTCGKGMRHRQVSCSMGAGEEKLSEHFCDLSSKPQAVGSCELPECASWQVGVWGAVSPTDRQTDRQTGGDTHTHTHR